MIELAEVVDVSPELFPCLRVARSGPAQVHRGRITFRAMKPSASVKKLNEARFNLSEVENRFRAGGPNLGHSINNFLGSA